MEGLEGNVLIHHVKILVEQRKSQLNQLQSKVLLQNLGMDKIETKFCVNSFCTLIILYIDKTVVLLLLCVKQLALYLKTRVCTKF